MLFNSFDFVVFFAVVLALFWTLPERARIPLLLVSSYVFYGSWDYRFLSLILFTTAVDYAAARLIHASRDPVRRRLFLLLSLGTNLAVLGFFKYFNFFVGSLRLLLGRLGIDIHTGTLDIILPVGISFYTFQSMAYTIDVYRGTVEPSRHLLSFATFVAYFPQLMAGPISRFHDLYPQLVRRAEPNALFFRRALFLFLQGYVKKVVIADGIAPIVDAGFALPQQHDSGQLLEAAILFTAQIYCDFSGYSDIARAVSYCFGVELVPNFRAPLLSGSITEFWRRWHVSLSQWLRDYLYIPLGGNRHGAWRTYANLMVTMLLGGLWHGANWKFIAWGGLHGLALAIERMLGVRAREGEQPASGRARWAGLVLRPATFLFVVAAFVFFRAASIGNGWLVITGIFAANDLTSALTLRLGCVLGAILCLDLPIYLTDDQAWPIRVPLAPRVLLYAALLLVLIVLSGSQQAPFIYFAF